MEAKLTLKLDKNVIDEAKMYAKSRNISLSRMVEKYFKSLVVKKRNKKKYPPLVEELSGIIKLENDFDFRDDYTNFLIEKYQ
jgi:hypothetical protein